MGIGGSRGQHAQRVGPGAVDGDRPEEPQTLHRRAGSNSGCGEADVIRIGLINRIAG